MVPWGRGFLSCSLGPRGTQSSLLRWLLCFVTVFRPCPPCHPLCEVQALSLLPLGFPPLSYQRFDLRFELTVAPATERALWGQHPVEPQPGLGVLGREGA